MPDQYDSRDWYWIVAGSDTQVYSSVSGDYVPVFDPRYQAWVARGNVAPSAPTEADLVDNLIAYSVRPVSAGVLDIYKDRMSTKLTVEIVTKMLFWLVNEVRVLKGQPVVTPAQFKNFIKGLM